MRMEDMDNAETRPWGDDGPTDELLAERKRERTRVGALVAAWGDAVDQVEALYAETNGEVTDATAVAEAWAEMAEKDAAESLARFERFCCLTLDSIKAEKERLDASKERMESRLQWTRDRLLELLGERKSLAVGPYRICSRSASSVVAEPDLDIDALAQANPALVRWSDPVPPKPALDKAACKVALTDGLPPAGVRLVTVRKVTVR